MTAHAAAVHSMPPLAPAGPAVPAGSAAASAAVTVPVPSHSVGVSRGKQCSVPSSLHAERGSHTPAQSSCRFQQHLLSALQAIGLNLHFANPCRTVWECGASRPDLKHAGHEKQSEGSSFCDAK